jgi:hypothetical protein
VPWHADGSTLLELTEDVQIWKAMSEYAAAPVSGGDSSGLKRDGGGAQRRQGVRSGRGDEAPLLPLLEAVEVLPLLPSSRRPHCSNCTAVEALHCSTEARGDPATVSNRVYLDGRR